MRLRRAIPAGLVDSGFASLATLAVGLYAARVLDAVTLGVYALFVSAFLMATVVPGQLMFVPAEVEAVSHPVDRRLSLLGRSVFLGSWVAAAGGGVGVVMAWLLAPAGADAGVVTALAATVLPLMVLSPLQDHVRRMLHVAQDSWAAAIVSVVQFLGVLVAVAAIDASGAGDHWVPFGALAVANAVSLTLGLGLARHRAQARASVQLRPAELMRAGRWYLLSALGPAAAGFASAALVAALAGAEDLGYAEAARVVGQALLVFAMGLQAVMGPRSMEAAAQRDRREADRLARIFTRLMLLVGVGFLVFLSVDWPGNPLSALIPQAYEVRALVAITAVANIAHALAIPAGAELMGGRQEARMAKIAVVGSIARVGVAGAAGLLRSAAIPLGFLGLGLVKLGGYVGARRGLYPDDEA